MVVLILDRTSPGIRGELTRWMLQPRAGVFVGSVSAMVRDRLWTKVCAEVGAEAGCVMLHTANNEQGFSIRTHGKPSRAIDDFEGLLLIRSG